MSTLYLLQGAPGWLIHFAQRSGRRPAGSRSRPPGRRDLLVRRTDDRRRSRRGRRPLPRPASGSTPPTPATRAPARASGWPPSTSPSKLAEVGIEPSIHESAPGPGQRGRPDPRRRPVAAARCWCTATSTWCRPTPSEWSVHPFSGEIRDGYLWGRGAIDMKDFDAMVLAVVRQTGSATGVRPPRDLVLAFTRRRGGRRRLRRALPGRQPRRPVRGLHRGDRRGRRLLLHGRRRPAALPDRDRREGHRLAAAARPRPPRARLDVHDDNAVTALAEAVAAGRPAPVPGRDHRRPCARSSSEVSDALGIELDPDDPEAGDRQARPDRPDHRRDHPQHRQPDPARRRLQGQRDPEPGDRHDRLPHPARPARDRSSSSCAR